MQQEGTVILVDAHTGRFGVQVRDGDYLLAEQLDVQPLKVGDALSGRLETVGSETLTNPATTAEYSVFILAYGLSQEAVEQELRG